MTFPPLSGIPGASVPGRMVPGDPEGEPAGYLYLGHIRLYYLDYIDERTGCTLIAIPGGGSYAMSVASGRVWLTIVPPPDGRWQGGEGFYEDFIEIQELAPLAAGRAQNADLHAILDAKPVWYPEPASSFPDCFPARKEPSEYAAMLAKGRAVNAELQARLAGVTDGN